MYENSIPILGRIPFQRPKEIGQVTWEITQTREFLRYWISG